MLYLDEAQVGIKIAGRNINNLRCANDTTLMTESKEELKSFVLKVKEGSEKVGLKLNIKNIIMALNFGIKIVERNINNLRYADDATLMAESKEEPKSLLMKVKEESEKASLKLNIQKIEVMASDSITSW